MARGLGRREPTDDIHIQRYSLTRQTMPTVPTPVVLGINWYSDFDHWVTRRERGVDRFYIGLDAKNLGVIEGGHCICVRPPSIIDRWWPFYDQGQEGACVGFGWSRFASLMNRRQYDGFSLYHAAQIIDEWGDTPPESGTSVRAGGDVMRDKGAWRVRRSKVEVAPHPLDGIDQNRWATSVEEIAACLSPADNGRDVLNKGFVILLNSWGKSYPPEVRMPLETLDRVIFAEHGDATVATDRPSEPNTSP